jgi:small GTP-binding protein
MKNILNEEQEIILAEERNLLNHLRVALVEFGVTPEDQIALGQSIQQLDELFMLVVVGEFNSGKSAFINALIGQQILKEGVTPTTTQISVLRYGESTQRSLENENMQIIRSPIPLLQDLSIVDTPGTNAIIREHEAITAQFVPRSDLVLFITSADRPFTESERAFLEMIRDWGKKVVFVLNKTDLFQNDEDLKQVKEFISDHAQDLFGVKPEIFPVSSRLAQKAKQGEPSYWDASQFEHLEQFIYHTLDETGRILLKFNNPLGVGMNLVNRYMDVIQSRLDLLRDDFVTLEDVDSQLTLYKEDMLRDFNFRMSDIENILFEMDQRGQTYCDETLRLARVFDLINKNRIQDEFARNVVADVPDRIEKKVNELIDWLVDADFKQWQAVMEHLAERRREHKERIVGDVGTGSFHTERDRLIEGVGREAQRVVERYDKSQEAATIAEGAQQAVAAMAAVEVGAVGLGTLITILATTAAADVTGVVLASVIAALGLFIIPAKRRQAKKEMRDKIANLREQLVESLKKQFIGEIERSVNKINEAIGPYTRFVRAEKTKLRDSQQEFVQIKTNLIQCKSKIEESLK